MVLWTYIKLHIYYYSLPDLQVTWVVFPKPASPATTTTWFSLMTSNNTSLTLNIWWHCFALTWSLTLHVHSQLLLPSYALQIYYLPLKSLLQLHRQLQQYTLLSWYYNTRGITKVRIVQSTATTGTRSNEMLVGGNEDFVSGFFAHISNSSLRIWISITNFLDLFVLDLLNSIRIKKKKNSPLHTHLSRFFFWSTGYWYKISRENALNSKDLEPSKNIQ